MKRRPYILLAPCVLLLLGLFTWNEAIASEEKEHAHYMLHEPEPNQPLNIRSITPFVSSDRQTSPSPPSHNSASKFYNSGGIVSTSPPHHHDDDESLMITGMPRKRNTPNEAMVSERICRRCDSLIETPPYMKSLCCSQRYHQKCQEELMAQGKTQCPDCQQRLEVEEDKNFAEEVKQYDWSLFGLEPDNSDTGVTTPQPKTPSATNTEVTTFYGKGTLDDFIGMMSSLGIELDADQLISELQTAPAPSEAPIRASSKLDIPRMTNTLERVLGAKACHLDSDKYNFFARMEQQGIAPDWIKICNKEVSLSGLQTNLQDKEASEAFFTELESSISTLVAPNLPIFFAFTSKDPVQPPHAATERYISRIMRIIPDGNGNCILMMTADPEELSERQKQAFQSRVSSLLFSRPIKLVQYLRYIASMSAAKEALFVRPLGRGEEAAETHRQIPIKDFSEANKPFDLLPGTPTKDDREILAAAALGAGLKYTPNNVAKTIPVLRPLLLPKNRGKTFSKDALADILQQIKYECTYTETLRSSDWETGLTMAMLSPELAEMEAQLNLQKVVALQMHNLVNPTNGYILLSIQPNKASAEEENLCIAVDNGRYYIVNMKNKIISTQQTENFFAVCDYLQVFLAGCHGGSVEINCFTPVQTKTRSAS